MAEAAFLAGDFEEVMRDIDGWSALNQSPPDLIPAACFPAIRVKSWPRLV